VEQPDLLPGLASLDFVICGTDDTTSRAYLNQLCHQFYVPVLDLGVQFAADPVTEKLVKEVGRANLMLPGTPCMACSGQIDPQQLQAEGLPPDEREKRRLEGYVAGVDITEPSMMVFNMQVAARGLQNLIAWATGLVPTPQDEMELFRFLGLGGAEPGMRRARKRTMQACPICSEERFVLGTGDRTGMLVAPRPERR
jgi:molybdopterin/thiamine biosynthesis adenylyltransferase